MMSGDAPVKEKRKKSKHPVVDTETQEDLPKKERKSKKTHRDTTNGASEVVEDTVQTVIMDGVATTEATKPHKEKKKKNRQKDDKHALEDPRNSTEEDSKPSKKKRKRSPVDAVVDQLQADKPTKKRKKHKQTALTNPSEDETLSDQARKSLTYVFTHFEHPDAWKFNKAKQNWLIRNLWSDQAIPELYLPLSIKYLSGVKGGIRDALSKTCNDLLGEVGELPSQSDTPGATPTEAKYVRAKILLDALQNENH